MQVGGDLLDKGHGRLAAAFEQRADRGEVNAHERARLARQRHGSPGGQAQRLAKERVHRQVQPVGAGEPLGSQVVRSQLEGGAAVGHEGTLTVGRDDDADAAGPRPGHADDPNLHAIAAHGIDQRTARGIPADRRDQGRPCTEATEPARGVRRRATLDERDPAGHVGRALEGAGRREDDVEQEVAEHDDARRAARRRDGTAGRVGVGAGRAGSAWVSRIGAPAPVALGPVAGRPTMALHLPARAGVPPDDRCRDARPRPPRDRHDPDAVDGRRPAGELRASGRPDGRGADGLHAVDAVPAARPDATPSGRTATASCCPPATPRCCCTRSST